LFIAAAATLAHWPVPFAAVALGGIGALWQIPSWEPQCRRAAGATYAPWERALRPQLRISDPARGGVAGFNNDVVNAVCSGVGALVALLLS